MYTFKFNFSKYRNENDEKKCILCNKYFNNLQLHILYNCEKIIKYNKNNKLFIQYKTFDDINKIKIQQNNSQILPFYNIDDIFSIVNKYYIEERLI